MRARKAIYLISAISAITFLALFIMYRRDPQKSRLVIDDDTAIQISILEDTITEMGLTVIIKNNSPETIYFTKDMFSLEYKKNGHWYRMSSITTGSVVTATRSILRRSQDVEFDISWDYKYGQIGDGEYRVIFPISYGEDTIFIASEFTRREGDEGEKNIYNSFNSSDVAIINHSACYGEH